MKAIKTVTAYKYNYMQSKAVLDFTDVKPVPASFSEFDKYGHVITEIMYLDDGGIEHKCEYRYNEKGLLTEELLYNDEGFVDEKKKYEYDSNNRMVKEFLVYQDESFDTTEYLYNEEGRLVKKTTFDPDGVIESSKEMDYENGNLSCEISYNAEGNIINKVNHKYDEKGNEIEVIRYNAEDDKTIRTEFVFSEGGKKTEALAYNANNELIARSQYKDNDKGQTVSVIEEERFNYNTTIMSYDEKGNVTEQEETNKAGELNSRISMKFDEDNLLVELAVMIDRHGKAPNQNYVVQYKYEFFISD